MRRAYSSTVIYIILTLVMVSIVFIFLFSMQSTLEVSDFSLRCATPISTKNLYYSLPPQARVGSAPILHQLCHPVSREIHPTSVNNTAFNLYQMASTCWGSLGKADLVADEGNTLPCYVGSFYTSEKDLTISAKDMKTYFDSQNTTMRVVFVKYDESACAEYRCDNGIDDDSDGEVDEKGASVFIDMNEGVEDFPDDFQAEILFSDWKTYSEDVVPIANVPYLRNATSGSYLTHDTRQPIVSGVNQDSDVVNGYTSYQVWEDSVIDLTYPVTLIGLGAMAGLWAVGGPPGIVIGAFMTWLFATYTRIQLVTDIYGIDRVTQYYETLSCGPLYKSMVCCEDRVVICIKEP